ncbi:conserved hypothetical protein [Trichinella spiralis]|uniref:hypothetical protein n=1 Tax=Trichinella spiralis TaxID=6334 RepID=UPI0001EFDCF3|nr:conserved hypothetical protein [Trichinella spiralis]
MTTDKRTNERTILLSPKLTKNYYPHIHQSENLFHFVCPDKSSSCRLRSACQQSNATCKLRCDQFDCSTFFSTVSHSSAPLQMEFSNEQTDSQAKMTLPNATAT